MLLPKKSNSNDAKPGSFSNFRGPGKASRRPGQEIPREELSKWTPGSPDFGKDDPTNHSVMTWKQNHGN